MNPYTAPSLKKIEKFASDTAQDLQDQMNHVTVKSYVIGGDTIVLLFATELAEPGAFYEVRKPAWALMLPVEGTDGSMYSLPLGLKDHLLQSAAIQLSMTMFLKH